MDGGKPIWLRQRESLRAFQGAVAARVRLEADYEGGFRDRNERAQSELQQAQIRLAADCQEATAAVERETNEARRQINERSESAMLAAEEELALARQCALDEYGRDKHRAQNDFQESRWTITTVYEAGRKVAKDQFQAAQTRALSLAKNLREQQSEALQLLQSWKFANDLPLVAEAARATDALDPWLGLQMCAAQATNAIQSLRGLSLPARLKGALPWLLLGLVWLLGSTPALFLDPDYAWYWLLANTLAVAPLGLLLRYHLIQRARTQVVSLWRGICQAGVDGKKLRQRCVEQARMTYRLQRRDNKKRSHESIFQAAANARARMLSLRQHRGIALRAAQDRYDSVVGDLTRQRDQESAVVETRAQKALNEIAAQHDDAVFEAEERFRKARDENNRRHAADWTRLVGDWKNACEAFQTETRAVDLEGRHAFPPWERCLQPEWRLPAELPQGLRFGSLDIKIESLADATPAEPHIARLELAGVEFPALLPFPERASLLLMAQDDGKAAAVRSLQALLLRAWTALPAGKVRCTIIDPVGRGENFSAFMHLADHDESLVGSRIWTEQQHIEQRLADLTAHMEVVLQKYLRNQFQTLAEYNAQAGEVAEPFRFLVVVDFPINFSADAARRLISLASAGARCGIYVLVMVDERQPLPQGIELADLERACLKLNWKNNRFVWADPAFAQFPLVLDQPPDPETATHILTRIGAQAKEASRVEVPFTLIAPPPELWWQADSRNGISVPLGRLGATANQNLALGQGTAQHVLIAGKTGSGKSTLLHVLIGQIAMRYSPDEVELYLIDFKKGVEFKTYAVHQLPHARVVAVESEREFGLSVLQRLDAELVRRGDWFRGAGVSDLPSYRNLPDAHEGNGEALPSHVKMPRVVLIVDEFQEFFVEDDKLAQEAALLLDRLVRQGRAFGIHVLLGSQTLGGAYSLARTTIDQMAVRIALQCSEADAHLVLSKDNGDARLLSRPGEAIYNAANGLLEGNHLFQVVWLSDTQRDSNLRQVRQLSQELDVPFSQIVFEGMAPSDMARNALLRQAFSSAESAGVRDSLHAWLGDAVAIKDPTAAVFRRRSGQNLLLVGQDEAAAFQMIVAALVSLSPCVGQVERALQLVVADSVTPDGQLVLDALPGLMPVLHVPHRNLGETLAELHLDLQGRLQGEEGPPRFLVLYGLQKMRELRRSDDDFGFGRKGESTTPLGMFIELIREGPPMGLFTIAWCDSLPNLQRAFDRQALREFEMRVLMQMSSGDSSTLIDAPLAARLGLYRALFASEDQGRLEKFRPYGLPSLDWLREVNGMLQRHSAVAAAAGETK